MNLFLIERLTMRKHLRFRMALTLLLLVSLIFLSACGRPSLTPIASDGVILAYGDSLTFGEGVNRENSYPAVLSQLSNRTVINAGLNGETTEQALTRLPLMLAKHQPAMVILLMGGNDFLRKVPAQTTQANLAKLVEMIQASGAQVMLVGVPAKKLFADTAELYYEVASAYEVPLEEDAVASLMVRASMKSDYVHFNEKGYQALAEAIYQSLISSGALTAN
ncbi:MAG: arylesterase [Thiotrichales bacterium]|nr:arylesterase [Thiotrichales bacterium]